VNEILRFLLDLPPQASTYARSVDLLHYAVITCTMLGATTVFVATAYFVVRYRRREEGETTPALTTPVPAEIFVIGSLVTLFLTFWVVGSMQYDRMFAPPADAMVVDVTAKQWMWKFSYPDGRASMDQLTVPVGRPIKLVMTSRDVIHSFYVPAFRMKHDVVPGRYYSTWFQATEPGTYDIECAEFCGLDHSRMLGTVRVLSEPDYAAWLGTTTPGPDLDLVAQGRDVAARRACLGCHTLDGQRHIGPTWVGLYGSEVRLRDGRTVRADDAYLTRSMMEPLSDVVDGYAPVMPTFRGVLEQPEVAALLELIRSLRDVRAAPAVTLPPVAPLGSGEPQEPKP
jgi:cytochrome c oxidase subunit 2